MKKKKIILTIMIALILTITLLVIIKPTKTSEPIIKEKRYYTLKIDQPFTEVKEIDEETNKIIKESILETVHKSKENKKWLKENKLKYELIISYEKYRVGNIKTLRLKKYYFSGGANYEVDNYTYHYNDETKTKLSINDFFKPNSNFLDIISKKSYYKLLDLKFTENIDLFTDEEIKNAVKPEEKTFEHFYFDDRGMNIIFPSYKVGPRYIGDIKIEIPLSEIEDIISFKMIYNKEKPVSKERKSRNIENFKNKKVVAFTFDDGPAGENTNYLINQLNIRNAKASFFVLGNRVMAQADLIRTMYNEGHTIGSHSYAHLNLTYLGEYELYKDIKNTTDAINSVLGVNPFALRPPYGNLNDNVKNVAGLPIILWSVDPLDWKYRDAQTVYKNIMSSTTNGSVILLHDLYRSSIDGALMAMDDLKKQGFEFVSLEEMFALKGIEPHNQTVFNKFN
ncbi:MAG: polysaccharide deacetylase family protein [Bacilli bacterium]